MDLPSGEMTVEAEADVPEDLPSGKRSRTEAKEEDVEMNEVKEEEPPQDDPNAQLAPEEEAPDFGGDVEIDDDVSETNSQKMQRANRLLNSGILDRFANSKMNLHLDLDHVRDWQFLLWQTSSAACYLKTRTSLMNFSRQMKKDNNEDMKKELGLLKGNQEKKSDMVKS